MALQVIEQPQPTGLTTLGNAISGVADNYANLTLQQQEEKRRREQQLADEATKRQQHLQDVAESERFQTGEEGSRMTAERMNQEAKNAFQVKMALHNEGLLDLKDFDDPDKVAAAYQEAVESGLKDKYKGAMTTPNLSVTLPDGTHPPFLTAGDLHDKAKVSSAMDAYAKQQSDQVAQQLDRAQQDQKNARLTANRLQSQYSALNRKADTLEADVPESELNAQPDPNVVRRTTIQQLTQQNGGKPPSEAEINAAEPEVLKGLQAQMATDLRNRMDMRRGQAQTIRYQAQSIGSQLGDLVKQKIYPDPDAEDDSDAMASALAVQPTGLIQRRRARQRPRSWRQQR